MKLRFDIVLRFDSEKTPCYTASLQISAVQQIKTHVSPQKSQWNLTKYNQTTGVSVFKALISPTNSITSRASSIL
jgi:hypothetical protein